MRWISTIKSFDIGEMSFLAITETVISVVLVILFIDSYYFSKSLVLGFIFAPLLLMATNDSRKLALAIYEKLIFFLNILPEKISGKVNTGFFDNIFITVLCVPLIITYLISIIFISLISRFLGGFCTFVRHPFSSMKAIPENWKIYALVMDIFKIPEILPGRERKSRFISDFWNKYHEKQMLLKLQIILTVLTFIPSYFFRYFMKSTTLIYVPFIFIIKGSLKDVNIKDKLKEIIMFDGYILMRRVSVIIIAIFCLKLYFYIGKINESKWFNEYDHFKLLSLYWQPGKIALWHIVAPLNGFIAIYLGYFSKLALYHRIPSGEWSEDFVDNTRKSLFLMRGFLSLYNIICSLYIFTRFTLGWNWPPLEIVVFPW